MAVAASRSARAAPAVGAAAVALAVGAVAEAAALGGDVWDAWLVGIDALTGVTTVFAGLAAWIARPDSRTGGILVAIGGLWFLGAFGYGEDQALVDLVGFPLQGWNDVLLVALLLALAPPGLRGGAARGVAVGVLASHAVLALARLLLRPPNDVTSCFCIPNRITGVTDPAAYEAVVRVASFAEAAFAIAALGILVVRWHTATGAARRTLGGLLAAGTATAALVTYNRIVTRVVSDPVEPSIGAIVLLDIVRVTIPLAIAASLVRGRRARTRVADVVLSLDDHGVAGGSAVLRRALADPSVRLLRWSPEREGYLDAEGAEATMPQAGEPLAATMIERDGTPLGAIVHDAALREEPELLRAVAAAARLALHNERLAEEVRARLEDVQASRQRIVAAGDAERRRLERDLHDGAQQRLVALALRLRTLERATGASGNIRLADDLELLASELDTTIAEVRELARGIRPPALGEAGLGAALEALADRTPLPMRVDAELPRRLPDVVEAAAYFAASEAVANALKHAGAGHVRIAATDDGDELVLSVADDGSGGAEPRAGGGLVGLADRLEALGGELAIDSALGGGTTLTARIPLAAAPTGDQAAGAARR